MFTCADECMLRPQHPNSLPDGSVLCLSCGLCCVGVIYRRAGLGTTETDLAHSLGLTIVTFEGQLYFSLPCPLYKQNCCSVYAAARPSVCADYQCNLLKKILSKQITLEQGLQVIRDAKKFWTEVVTQLPPNYSFYRIRLLFEKAAATETGLKDLPDVLRQNPNLLRALFRLEWHLIKHFYLARKSGEDG